MDASLWTEGYAGVWSAGTTCSKADITEIQLHPACAGTTEESKCNASEVGASDLYYYNTSCGISSVSKFIDRLNLGQPLLALDYFTSSSCDSDIYESTSVFIANGSCIRGRGAWYQVDFDEVDGSTTVSLYYDPECNTRVDHDGPIDQDELCSNACHTSHDTRYIQVYGIPPSAFGCSAESTPTLTPTPTPATSAIQITPTSSFWSASNIAAVVGGSIAVILVTVLLVWCLCVKRKTRARELQPRYNEPIAGKTDDKTMEGTADLDNETYYRSMPPRGSPKLWDDHVIVCARVPREKVIFGPLISRGGYGNVYQGTFNGQPVAIKTLLASTKSDEGHINGFLAEVKIMVRVEHPNVVQFVGVAWDALCDLCALSEFVNGGDLYELLKGYVVSNHPVGFDRTKLTIALQIAHALTYLHSLASPIIHRDLKSRNVLLTEELDVKLTDFGSSRECLDGTMTAGVGTMLWMAPEVMTDGHYDEKADMFSFGVLLSELDTHTIPYEHARRLNDGRRLTDAAVLTKVSNGALRVQFSPPATRAAAAIVELGNACVSLQPHDRPSAAQALYHLQMAQRELA